MLFGDSFLCHGSHSNTVSENPTVRMKDELLPHRDLLLARKLDGEVLAPTMSESPGRLDDLIDSHNRSAIADGNLFHTNRDRKSTRLNSSHVRISYAVFCLKKTNR